MIRIALTLAAALGLLVPASGAHARAIEGVDFEDRIDLGDTQLTLHGTGLLRYRVFIRGYVAALYLDEAFRGRADPPSVLADTPRRLEIEYFWSIGAEDFARATHEGIARSTSRAVHAR